MTSWVAKLCDDRDAIRAGRRIARSRLFAKPVSRILRTERDLSRCMTVLYHRARDRWRSGPVDVGRGWQDVLAGKYDSNGENSGAILTVRSNFGHPIRRDRLRHGL